MHISDFLIFQEKGLHARKLTIEEVFGNSVLLSSKITSKRNGKAAFFLSAQKQIQMIITFYLLRDIAIGFS